MFFLKSEKNVKYVFSNTGVVGRWIALGQHTVHVSSINAFKWRLNKLRHKMVGF